MIVIILNLILWSTLLWAVICNENRAEKEHQKRMSDLDLAWFDHVNRNKLAQEAFSRKVQMRHLNLLVKTARIKKGISQGDLAMRLGYSSAQFVSNWERELSNPPVEKLKKLSKMLAIPREQILEAFMKDQKETIERFL